MVVWWMVFFGGSITTGDSFFRRESVAGGFSAGNGVQNTRPPWSALQELFVCFHILMIVALFFAVSGIRGTLALPGEVWWVL